MIKKNIGIILLIIFCLFPIYKTSAQNSNAGFIPGNIWYSKDPFEEGDKIKIYTLIFNPDTRELSGTVVFFDNNAFLGKKDFIADAKGVKDISLDWTVTVGAHNIFGKIENSKFLVSSGKYEEVYLAENETTKSSRTVTKKIVPVADQTVTNPTPESNIAGSESVKNIEKIIGSNTPEFIAKPMVLGASTVENFRQDMGTSSETKKTEVQNQIKTLDASGKDNTKTKTSSSPKSSDTNKFLKPFKYVELFFFTFLSFILNNRLVFYGASLVIIFIILRYIWRLIF